MGYTDVWDLETHINIPTYDIYFRDKRAEKLLACLDLRRTQIIAVIDSPFYMSNREALEQGGCGEDTPGSVVVK